MTSVDPATRAVNSGVEEVRMDVIMCATCRSFCLPAQTATVGQCRRMPPTWNATAAQSEWPRVGMGDWCSEWRAPVEVAR